MLTYQQSYSVFLNYYLAHGYFRGTSTLTYAFVGGLSISMALFVSPVATLISRSFGTKACLHLGVLFQTAALIGVSFAHDEYQLILGQGFCFGFGMGFLFAGSVGIVPQWFHKRRGLANGIVASGSGAGGLVYALTTQPMIDNLGVPWAYRILGIVSCGVNLIAVNLVQDRNKAVGAKVNPFDLKLLRRPEYLLLQGWAVLSILGYVVVLFSLPNYGTTIGLSASQGSIVAAVLSAGQMIGRPITGFVSDWYGRINIAAIFSAGCGIFCLIFWIPSNGMGLLTFFALVGGMLAGTIWPVIASVYVEVVGLQDLPAALSMTWLILTPPATCSEAIALKLRKPGRNGYIDAQVFTAMMFLGAGMCMWFVRAWKVGEVERSAARLQQPTESGSVAERKTTDGANGRGSRDGVGSSDGGSWHPRTFVRGLVTIKHV